MSTRNSFSRLARISSVWVAAMSGALSLVREVAATFYPGKVPNSQLFRLCCWGAFVISAGWAWWNEHHLLIQERRRSEELEAQLRAIPLQLELEIDKEVFHRPSMETHWFRNSDLFLQVTSYLTKPFSVEVEYALDVIVKGKTVHGEWLVDMGNWLRINLPAAPDPFGENLSVRADERGYFMDNLPTHLYTGAKVNGWLHFRVNGLPNGELEKFDLRLLAKSQHGTAHYDLQQGSWKPDREFRIVTRADAKVYFARSHTNPQPPPL